MVPNRLPLRGTELAIMKLLWSHGQMVRRDIQQSLTNRGKAVVSGTVQKCLARLERKGYVIHNRQQMTHIFQPAIPLESYALDQLRGLSSGDASEALDALLRRLLRFQKRANQ